MTRPAAACWGAVARTVSVVLVIVAGLAAPAAAHALPTAVAPDCTEPGGRITQVSWAQRLLAPERVWSFTRGGGVTVAVLDSGVDASHAQLAGEIRRGLDVRGGGSAGADSDCRGTGTQIAGVIGAWQTQSTGFVGLAPNAAILPIRVVGEQDPVGEPVPPQVLAQGVRAALDSGADVIAVPVVSYTDAPALRDAVADAVRAGVVVVAAVGDKGGEPGGGPTPYPAAYEGVIGVGAIAETGVRWPNSQAGGYVDVVAPGAGIVTVQRAWGLTVAEGTGVACGFVAAAAALAIARRGLRGAAIERLLLATAVPGPGGPEYGHGVVNPYAAVNDHLVQRETATLPALAPPTRETASDWLRSRDFAVAGAALLGLIVIGVVAAAITLPRGRRRRWRAAMAPPPPRVEEPEEPGPPLLLFDEQR